MVQSIAAERVLCTNWRETPLRPPVTVEHAGQKLDRLITECHGEPRDVDQGRQGPKSIMTYYAGQDPRLNIKTRTIIRGDADHPASTTSFEWDEGYRLIKQTDPAGRTQTWTYDAAGLLTATKDEWDIVTQDSVSYRCDARAKT